MSSVHIFTGIVIYSIYTSTITRHNSWVLELEIINWSAYADNYNEILKR